MPRFVVLRHELPPTAARSGVHWDLMLEHEGKPGTASLRTWALEVEPAADIEIVALALADHRVEYLAYEGPVSGDRGVVERWDEGEYVLEAETDEAILFSLRGKRLVGRAKLTRNDQQHWRFLLEQQD